MLEKKGKFAQMGFEPSCADWHSLGVSLTIWPSGQQQGCGFSVLIRIFFGHNLIMKTKLKIWKFYSLVISCSIC